jgi:hypothetical protein
MPTYRERIQKNEGKGKIVREWSREHMRKQETKEREDMRKRRKGK